MPAYDATVGKHPLSKREHCVANGADLDSIGRGVGQQVRIVRPGNRVALYTVQQAGLDRRGRVGMANAGMQRLRGAGEFAVTVDAQVVDQHRNDDGAAAAGEFVERLLVGTASTVAVIAPHGGAIERRTDEQADRVGAGLGAAGPWVWTCKGWGAPSGSAFDRWHITSVDISTQSFPLLRKMARRRFTHAIAFHGFDIDDVPGPDVRIGGLAPPALKERVREEMVRRLATTGRPWNVAVVKKGDRLSGSEPENIVNRLAPPSGGLQIEQSLPARQLVRMQIADAVLSVYRSVLRIGA